MSEKLCRHSGRGVRSLLGGVLCCVLRVPACTMDFPAYVSVWRAVHAFWEGCAWLAWWCSMLCPEGTSLHHRLYTQLMLVSGGLCMHSKWGVRGLLGGALCCVLRVPACTIDYIPSLCCNLEGCACILCCVLRAPACTTDYVPCFCWGLEGCAYILR